MKQTDEAYLIAYDKSIDLICQMQLFQEFLLKETIPGDGAVINDTCIIDRLKLEQQIKKMKESIKLNVEMPKTVAGKNHQKNIDRLLRELKY
jgi:hypothetical protein